MFVISEGVDQTNITVKPEKRKNTYVKENIVKFKLCDY